MAAAMARREVEEEVDMEVEADGAFVVASHGHEGSSTSIARGLFRLPFVASETKLCFISKRRHG